jgi:hypothetical protein
MTASMQPSGELGVARGRGGGGHEVGGGRTRNRQNTARPSLLDSPRHRGHRYSDGRKAFEIGHTIGSGYRITRAFFLGLIDHFVMAITAGQAPVWV